MTSTLYEFDTFDIKAPLLFNVFITIKCQSHTSPKSHLFFSRHIAMGRGGMEKVVHYSDDYLPATFSHPLQNMENCDMLSFLCGVLQVYLEFWNSSNPFEEYMPDFTKPSRCVQGKCAYMLTELLSLLKHIRSCQYLPNINTVEKMYELQKLNTDLIAISHKYFSTNIWILDSLEN